MKSYYSILATVPLVAIAISPALAQSNARSTGVAAPVAQEETAIAKPVNSDTVSTGVARGRDRLDSAVTTSTIREADILKMAPQTLGELMRSIPGIRSEAGGSLSVSLRGLPISGAGSKFLQLQEDGLPIAEFGDMQFGNIDIFLRPDLNLAQVDVIRGGSASTFASNSPGGIINLVSKTGDVEGGSVMLTGGLDFDQYRIDMNYGARVSDTLRVHVGGFYRQGEGPRTTGYDAQKGGQFKMNVTKDFAGGYIRFNAKYLDDRQPFTDVVPMRVTGSNEDPKYEEVAGFDANNGSSLSRFLVSSIGLDENNNPRSAKLQEGLRTIVKALGFETQFALGDWTVTERLRFSDITTAGRGILNPSFRSPAAVAAAYGAGATATFRYASGPSTGQLIADPNALNGNGLLGTGFVVDNKGGYDHFVNDLRVSRVWLLGGNELTTTAGVYASRQQINIDNLWNATLFDVRGDGRTALVDLIGSNGQAITQNGQFGFGSNFLTGNLHRSFRLNYNINAPFGSLNYRIGRLAIGGSLRYDFVKAQGNLYNAGPLITRDMNNDGTISAPERRVATLPLDRPQPVDYSLGYLSYSAGVNFRIAEPLAVFARYSRGGRANADRLGLTANISRTDGSLANPDAGVDTVKQAELGVKYRLSNLTLNLTGFQTKAEDTSIDSTAGGIPIARDYTAKGLEFEGGYRTGPFGLNGSVTYIDAKIERDLLRPEFNGKVPRRQADFIFTAMPQITTDRFSVGAIFIGTTGRFSSEGNQLRIPGYVTTNAFVQVRPVDRLTLSVNGSNLFDVKALFGVDSGTIPASGIVSARPILGRTVVAMARFDF